MKQKRFYSVAIVATFLSVATFSVAQVTIGGGEPPKAGTILDLNSTTKGGLQLSNVNILDLEKIPVGVNLFPGIISGSGGDTDDNLNAKLVGTIVWNLNNDLVPNGSGLYVWNGTKWDYFGGRDGLAVPPPSVTISAPRCRSIYVPNVTFMHYNLGADTTKFNTGEYATLSHPKRQIRYLAVCDLDKVDYVYGDIYQWGRKADGHEKRNSERFPTDNNQVENGAISDFDADGQPSAASGAVGKFIKHNKLPMDWRIPQKHDLWGNGESIDFNFGSAEGGSVPDSLGGFYQKPVKTVSDPCPVGWRIPTEDEFERLANYDCRPDTTSSLCKVPAGQKMPDTGHATTTRGAGNELTWVPVTGGKAGHWANIVARSGGYAIYKTSVWNAAIDAGGYLNGVDWSSTTKRLYDAAAPEPLLFLPGAGSRNSKEGDINNSATFYWVSTVRDTGTYFANPSHYGFSLGFLDFRSYGFIVRCVKN
ncbi:MAG: fibrobacter succinogenes major paralogous domain-containing protein [Prevotellaceae bacterium]|jgi:hypothetical protein|nr:fibrobacter succinogenes major paralogous domain-containing protein [Prevotellaceae bacterium]